MMRGVNNMQWIDWKKEQTERVANIYKDEEAFLNSNPKPKAAYYKGLLTSKKVKTEHPTKLEMLSVKEQRAFIPNPTRSYKRMLIRIIGPIKYKIHTCFFYNLIKHHLEKGHLDSRPTI